MKKTLIPAVLRDNFYNILYTFKLYNGIIYYIKKKGLKMKTDKNIQIGFTVNKVKNTITIKESILDLYSLTVTKHQKKYSENKTAINKTIKNLIGGNGTEIQGLSAKVSKFLLSCVSEELRSIRERNINLDQYEKQILSNAIFELIESIEKESARDKEVKILNKIFKQLNK